LFTIIPLRSIVVFSLSRLSSHFFNH
jgi:hypothetical protein